MKAKVINSKSKYYGRIVNVRKMEDTQFFANRYKMIYGTSVFFGDELDFNIAPVNNPVSFDWTSFRREAAKDILCSVVANPGRIGLVEYGRKDYRKSEYVRFAIDCADELIKQLKGSHAREND